MKRCLPGLALAALSLSLTAVSFAATTPEGTLKDFLKAAQKKDRKVLRSSVDWDAMAEKMGVGKEKDAERRKLMVDQVRIIFVESFALGKDADGYKVGDVAVDKKDKNEAKGAFLKQDPETKKYVPATIFSLHKKGKNWLIYNITSATKKPKESAKK